MKELVIPTLVKEAVTPCWWLKGEDFGWLAGMEVVNVQQWFLADFVPQVWILKISEVLYAICGCFSGTQWTDELNSY